MTDASPASAPPPEMKTVREMARATCEQEQPCWCHMWLSSRCYSRGVRGWNAALAAQPPEQQQEIDVPKGTWTDGCYSSDGNLLPGCGIKLEELRRGLADMKGCDAADCPSCDQGEVESCLRAADYCLRHVR